jgi:hypothetical protein
MMGMDWPTVTIQIVTVTLFVRLIASKEKKHVSLMMNVAPVGVSGERVNNC